MKRSKIASALVGLTMATSLTVGVTPAMAEPTSSTTATASATPSVVDAGTQTGAGEGGAPEQKGAGEKDGGSSASVTPTGKAGVTSATVTKTASEETKPNSDKTTGSVTPSKQPSANENAEVAEQNNGDGEISVKGWGAYFRALLNSLAANFNALFLSAEKTVELEVYGAKCEVKDSDLRKYYLENSEKIATEGADSVKADLLVWAKKNGTCTEPTKTPTSKKETTAPSTSKEAKPSTKASMSSEATTPEKTSEPAPKETSKAEKFSTVRTTKVTTVKKPAPGNSLPKDAKRVEIKKVPSGSLTLGEDLPAYVG